MNQRQSPNDQDILLDQILQNPYDLEARRVYADMLSERGDPKGEFILRQFDMEESAPWSPAFVDAKLESENLFQRHENEWESHFRKFLKQVFPADERLTRINPSLQYLPNIAFRFRFGFIDHFELNYSELKQLSKVKLVAPIRMVKLKASFVDESLVSNALTELASIRHIDIEVGRASNDKVEQIIHALDLPELESLRLRKHSAVECLKQRIERTRFANLISLDLGGNRISAADIKSLDKARCFENLEHLRLIDNPIGNGGAKYLAKKRNLSSLKSLDIKMTNIDDKGLGFFASQDMPNLTKLGIGWWFGTNPTDIGIRKLLDRGRLSNLTELDLTGWEMPKQVVQTIASAPELGNLKVLRLGNTKINDQTADILASSEHLTELDLLDLSAAKISDDGIKTLLQSRTAIGLTSLNLSGVTSLGQTDLKGIFDLPTLASLRHLNLSKGSLSGEGLKTILHSEALCDLQAIDLSSNEISSSHLKATWKEHKLESLCQIRLETDGLNKSQLNKLKKRYEGVFSSLPFIRGMVSS